MSQPQATINWTRPMMLRFKKAIAKAERDNAESFTFDGHEFVVAYAKYLLQYLEERL